MHYIDLKETYGRKVHISTKKKKSYVNAYFKNAFNI